jgi:sulfur carrier protein ThiS
LELDVNYAVVSSVIAKDDAFSEVGANDEIVSSSTDSEAAYKNLDVVEIKHLVVGAGDEVVSITTEKDDASLELDAGDEVVSSITEKDYSSSEAGANDEVVPRSTNSDAACKNLNVVEINEVVVGEDFDDNNPKSESESSSSSGDDKSDSSHDKDDVDDVPDLNPPSTTSSDPTKLRKAAWYLPSTASSATSKNKSTAS